MNGYPNRPITIIISILTLLSLAAAGCYLCQPTAPSYIDGIYYHEYQNPSMNGRTTFSYLQFYQYGIFTFVGITPEGPTPNTVVDVYEQIAISWLIPNAVPDHTGNYVLLGNRIYLNYPASGLNGIFPAWQSSGTYSAAKIVIAESNQTGHPVVEYLRYPPESAQVPVFTLGPKPGPCLAGTWRVDPDSYAAWMNALESKDPGITFAKVDPPLHFRFSEDGGFAMYVDEDSRMTFVSKDPAGGDTLTSMELDYSGGTLKGIFSSLQTDPAFPGLPLISIDISENSISVTSMKANGQLVPQGSSMNVSSMLDPSFYRKVGYACSGDSLQLIPLGSGLPAEGYILYQDNDWQPETR